MRHNNIINALAVNCAFPEVFEEIENSESVSCQYRRKLVHIRADYDGYKWWNTIWLMHDELATPEIRREVDAVYDALTSKDVFADLNALRSFCVEFPQAQVNDSSDDEYNFYLEGKSCFYWLRCITRAKDYNLYLHAFLMEGSPCKRYFDYLDALEAEDDASYAPENSIARLQNTFPELAGEDAATIFWRWERRYSPAGGVGK